MNQITNWFTGEVKSEQAQTDYDVSQAYSNYKLSQRELMNTANLGTGFKQEYDSGLKSQYVSSYNNAKSDEATSLSDLSSDYYSNLADWSSNVENDAESYSAIELAAQNRAKSLYSLPEDYSFYDTTGNTKTLENEGQYYLLNALYTTTDTGESFSDYLQNQDSELYDFYSENQNSFNEGIGVSGDTRSFDATNSSYITDLATEAETAAVDAYGDSAKSDTEFATQQEKLDYYTKVNESKGLYTGVKASITDISSGLSTPKTKINGKEYMLASTDTSGATASGEFSSIYGKQWYEALNSGDYKYGDVVSLNGKAGIFIKIDGSGKFMWLTSDKKIVESSKI